MSTEGGARLAKKISFRLLQVSPRPAVHCYVLEHRVSHRVSDLGAYYIGLGLHTRAEVALFLHLREEWQVYSDRAVVTGSKGDSEST